jgi:gliding motility-associated-like protein
VNPNTGIAVVTPSGGTPGYSFHWSNAFTDSLQTNLYAGSYTITVSDINSCDTVLSITITDESPMLINILPQMPLCFGDCNGYAQSSIIVQGTPPYQYLWSTNATTPDIGDLCAGPYMLTITDSNFCSRFQAVNVDQPNPITTEITTPGIDCWGGNTSLTAHVIGGGTAPFTFLWNTGETTTSINNAIPGTYWVISTDAHLCKDTTEINITQPPLLGLDTNVQSVICTGVCNGQVQVIPVGGTPPYNYLWNGISGGATSSNLCEGIYNITVTDNKGCTSIISTSVNNGGYSPPLDATADQYVVYDGQSTTLHAVTSTTINSYHWSPQNSLSGSAMQHPTASPEGTTTYTVTIIDGSGCANIDTVTITVMDVICGEPYIFVPNAFTPNDDGVNDILYVYAPMASDLYFAVYDRWGEMVFFTKEISKGWNGIYKGKALDPAVFVYYLKVTCVDNMIFEKQGNITLVR